MKPHKPYKRIPSISPRRRASVQAYNREARRVVEEARGIFLCCVVSFILWRKFRLVEEVHHMRGKGCEALRHDKRGWLLVSRKGHQWIDQHRAEARKLGWLGPWNTPFKDDELPMPGSVVDPYQRKILKHLWSS